MLRFCLVFQYLNDKVSSLGISVDLLTEKYKIRMINVMYTQCMKLLPGYSREGRLRRHVSSDWVIAV